MDSNLQEEELGRIRLIISQIQNYLDTLHNACALTVTDGRPTPSLDTLEGLLNVHWVDVRANAKRSERGELTKYSVRHLGINVCLESNNISSKTCNSK